MGLEPLPRREIRPGVHVIAWIEHVETYVKCKVNYAGMPPQDFVEIESPIGPIIRTVRCRQIFEDSKLNKTKILLKGEVLEE